MEQRNTKTQPTAVLLEMERRQAAEVALDDQEEIFSLLVEAVKDYAIFALDPTGHILTWNSGARRLKGYEAREIIGSHFSRFYTPEDIARNHPRYELEVASQTGTYEEEGWRVRKDGTRFWANVIITALRAPDGTLRGFGKVTRDLTQRKQAEEQLRNAYGNLERRVEERTAQLAQAKEEAERAVSMRDTFLSVASHELKTPLTSLKLQTQIRKRHLVHGNTSFLTPERFKIMIEDDERQINRLSRLVDDMLDITRVTAGKFSLEKENVELSTLVQEVVNRFSTQLETMGVAVTLDASTAINGSWDRHRIEQVVTNLLTNALKYGAGKPIRLEVLSEGPLAVLKVTDRGIGISEQDQVRVFRQFERAVSENEVAGLGLGLFIVQQIVEAHGGSVTLQSKLGEGSTFTVSLPQRN